MACQGTVKTKCYFTQDIIDVKTEALLKVDEGLLAGDQVILYATVHQFDAVI